MENSNCAYNSFFSIFFFPKITQGLYAKFDGNLSIDGATDFWANISLFDHSLLPFVTLKIWHKKIHSDDKALQGYEYNPSDCFLSLQNQATANQMPNRFLFYYVISSMVFWGQIKDISWVGEELSARRYITTSV